MNSIGGFLLSFAEFSGGNQLLDGHGHVRVGKALEHQAGGLAPHTLGGLLDDIGVVQQHVGLDRILKREQLDVLAHRQVVGKHVVQRADGRVVVGCHDGIVALLDDLV